MKEVIFTEEELNAKCKEWQGVLRLQDWVVVVKICREREMSSTENAGECAWDLSLKTGLIRILDPIDYPDGLMFPQNMENTLVHELLHLHFAPLYTEEKSTEIEQGINSITSGFISLARSGLNARSRSDKD